MWKIVTDFDIHDEFKSRSAHVWMGADNIGYTPNTDWWGHFMFVKQWG